LLSKMPFLGVVFLWDKNFLSKSCKLFLNAHFLENKFYNKLPVDLCKLVLSRL
jgi:DNA phosphorothioation-dependent restriction protein DptG